MILFHLPKANRFLTFMHITFPIICILLALSNLGDLILLKYDVINQNILKDAAYKPQ